MESLEAERYEQELLCSVANTTLLGVGQVPSCWSRSLEGHVRVGSIPSKCCSFSSQHWHLLPRREHCWTTRGWSRFSAWIWVWAVAAPVPVRVPEHFRYNASIITSNGCPRPIQVPFWIWAGTVSHNWALSLTMAVLTLVRGCIMKQLGHRRSSAQAGGCQSSCAKEARVPCSFHFFTCLASGISKCLHTLHKQSLALLQSSC